MGEKEKIEGVLRECPHDPTQYAGQPIGMYHCPECGWMVVAGVPHPAWHEVEEELEAESRNSKDVEG